VKTFSVRRASSLTGVMVQAIDFASVCVAGWLSYQLRFASAEGLVEVGPNERLLIFGMAAFAALFFGKVYRVWAGGSLPAMVGRVTLGWLFTWAMLTILLMLTKTTETYSRIWMVTWLVMGLVMLWLGRIGAFLLMAQMRRAGYQHQTVILYGDSTMMDAVRGRIEKATWSGYDIVAVATPNDGVDLNALNEKHKPDEIWIGLSATNQEQLDLVMNSLRNSVANIRLLPDLMMYRILNHGMSITVGIPMVDISVSPMFGERKLLKAMVDYLVASVILILLSPLLIAIAIGVKVTSPGPILFKQRRHGWNDEEIWVYKFRSMTMHQEQTGVVTQAKRNDARVTPFGAFLRRTSLDELPQFINVLQGRMSVVGPRPHAIAHNDEYRKLIPMYALRHKVKPGITGWAQICGYRGETDTIGKMEDRVRHDIFYLENWSVWMDLKIIFLTPVATIQNKNVY
jgi:putative colanic acid biosynthesis UDP-glucose lipid carrier transferase